MKTLRTYEFRNNQAIVQWAASLYRDGLTTHQVAERLGKSRACICLYLKSAGVPTRKSYRKYALDETFFDRIDTPVKAYWLGFLLADGCLHHSSLKLVLQLRDESHIVQFLKDVGSSSEVKRVTKQGKHRSYTSSGSYVCSVRMSGVLRAAGWDEFKKQGDCRIVESVPDNLRSHLMRGMFDGDGSIMLGNNTGHRATFIDMHRQPVEWFADHLDLPKPGVVKPANRRVSAWLAIFLGRKRIQPMYAFLYRDASVFLDRKKARFEEILALPYRGSDGLKKCNGCKSRLAKTLFYRNRAKWDGLDQFCKSCRKARHSL